ELSPTPITAATEARQTALEAFRLHKRMEAEIAAEKIEAEKLRAYRRDYQRRYKSAARKWVSTILPEQLFWGTRPRRSRET
ncbi:hypothetical protein E4U55_003694, partial [Claviceps digitariae]